MGTNLRTYLIWVFATTVALGYRLPQSVVPNEYNLEIITNLGDEDGKFDFKGKVAIDVTCKSPTENITLHAKNLQIEKDKVTVHPSDAKDGKQLKVKSVDLIKEDDFVVVHLGEALKEGSKYVVTIPYQGQLLDALAGYYKSYYTDKDGKKTWLAVTQFEPSDARRALPCFDEPAMKAKFTINLGRLKKYSSLSNMPIEKTEEMKDKPGWEWDRYQQSVPMSTYLVGFAVTDFINETSPKSDNNVTFRIWSRKEAANQIGFAKTIGPKFLSYFEKYFDIPYPLPKQDMIAVPDFSAGAMENWGFITYRETYLLYDPQQSSTLNQLSVASVVAHELAHQWFGNLVTMKWWTDLWLNEGFATYMSALAVENVFPEWKSLIEETADNIMAVFSFDSLQSSHPVSVPIGHPKEIDEIFDTISYKKGSYLLHTMSNFLGVETLQKGVSNYLKAHSYSNAEKDDLWESITEEAHSNGVLPKNLTVKTIMDTWAEQTGYPLINVKRNYGKNSVDVEQERFFRDNQVDDTECSSWWVPLTYTTQNVNNFNFTKAKTWMPPERKVMTIEGFEEDDNWIIFNIQASGLYRVNYDDKNWNLLIDSLKSRDFKKISILNRVLLIDDAANLAWIGRIHYKIFFDMLEYLQQETEYIPWKAAIRSVEILNSLLKRTAVQENFKSYVEKIIKPIYEKIGGFHKMDAKDFEFDEIQHRVTITSTACRYNVEKCVSQAKGLFKKLQEKNTTENENIPNELRYVVYCTAVKHGGQEEWDFLWNMYTVANVASIKNTILRTLGCARKPELLKLYLERAVATNTAIRKQDVATIFHSVISNDVGFQIARDYIRGNIKSLYERLKPTVGKLSSIISTLASYMFTTDEYEWLKNFTGENQEYFREIKNGVKQALETAKLNSQWHKLNFQYIKENLGRR